MCGGRYMNSPETTYKCFCWPYRYEEEEEAESERSKSFYSASSIDDFEHMDDIFL